MNPTAHVPSHARNVPSRRRPRTTSLPSRPRATRCRWRRIDGLHIRPRTAARGPRGPRVGPARVEPVRAHADVGTSRRQVPWTAALTPPPLCVAHARTIRGLDVAPVRLAAAEARDDADHRGGAQQEADVYPNPSSGWLTVTGSPNTRWELLDPQGRVALTHTLHTEQQRINATHLAPGIYLAVWQTSSGIQSRRVVIQ